MSRREPQVRASRREWKRQQHAWAKFHKEHATNALGAILAQLPPVDKEASLELQSALTECSKTHQPPSFGAAGARSGYIQQRIKSRSGHLGTILTHPDLQQWLTDLQERAIAPEKGLSLAAYGGGPGAEVLGMALVWRFLGLPGRVRGVVLDNEPGWEDAVCALSCQVLREQSLGEARFVPCDISLPLEQNPPAVVEAVSECHDIITFAYVVLENCLMLRKGDYCFLRGLFARSRRGCAFLFLDSSPRMWHEIAALVETSPSAPAHVPLFECVYVKCTTCKWTLIIRCLRAADELCEPLPRVLPVLSEEEQVRCEKEFAATLDCAEEIAQTRLDSASAQSLLNSVRPEEIARQVQCNLHLTPTGMVDVVIQIGDGNKGQKLSKRKRRALKREAKSFLLDRGEAAGIETATVAAVADAASESYSDSPSPAIALRQERIAEYDCSIFDIRSLVREIIGVPEELALHDLHLSQEGQECLIAGNEGGHRGNPFQGRWQRAKMGRTTEWQRFDELLKRFLAIIIAPLMGGGDQLIYQSEPTLRVQMPSDRSLGKPHTDADYHHLESEINFWIPLSDGLEAGNTLWSESRPGLGDFHPFVLRHGQLCRFYGNKCRHYTVPNRTTKTRVSIDLRVISDASGGFTQNPRFRIGEYFARLGLG